MFGNGSGDPGRWLGAASWAAAGALSGIALLLGASAGLVVLPLSLPLGALIYLLFASGLRGRPASVMGLLLAVDLFALVLLISPPCLSPLLRRADDGTFVSSCAAEQSMVGLFVAAVAGSIAVGGLTWGLSRIQRKRRSESSD